MFLVLAEYFNRCIKSLLCLCYPIWQKWKTETYKSNRSVHLSRYILIDITCKWPTFRDATRFAYRRIEWKTTRTLIDSTARCITNIFHEGDFITPLFHSSRYFFPLNVLSSLESFEGRLTRGGNSYLRIAVLGGGLNNARVYITVANRNYGICTINFMHYYIYSFMN